VRSKPQKIFTVLTLRLPAYRDKASEGIAGSLGLVA